MSWLDKQVSFYSCPADNYGRLATFRDILFADFAIPHEWFYKVYKPEEKWISGVSNDLKTIIRFRNEDLPKEQKTLLKQTMQCFTPAGSFGCKKKTNLHEIGRAGFLQLDFDYAAIKDYDIDELKSAVFDLPFVAFAGLSCSGLGFYALVQIAEPDRLNEYAEHCFEIFDRYGVPADTTKGRNVNDLRFVSYDSNMLIRQEPETLKIKQFVSKQKKPASIQTYTSPPIIRTDKIVNNSLEKIRVATIGNRWQTVQQVAYTLGGLNDDSLLSDIKQAIKSASEFFGEEDKYCECATVCFNAGKSAPLKPCYEFSY